jgi:hypothetical protein
VGQVGEERAHDRWVLHGGDDPQPAARAAAFGVHAER